MINELRIALRHLRRSAVFTAVAVASLALAIGANATIFSLVNAIVLRPLPVDAPGELYVATTPSDTGNDFSYPMLELAAGRLAGRAELCGQTNGRTLQLAPVDSRGDAAIPDTALVQLVTGDCFSVWRQRAAAGRLLGPADNRTVNGHPVAVISDRFWARVFNRSAGALGQSIRVNGVPLTIVGVTPPAFFGSTVGAQPPDLWAPVMMQAALRFAANGTSLGSNRDDPYPSQRGLYWLSLLVRAPSGAADVATVLSVAQVETLPADGPSHARLNQHVVLQPGARGFSAFRDRNRTQLLTLSVMVALLLALAGTNVAGVLLARAVHQSRDMAVRLAIGASRAALVRQLLAEGVLLALSGGALGLLFAWRGSSLLLTLLNRGTEIAGANVAPDWRVALLTLAAALVVGLFAGSVGAWRSTRLVAGDVMRATSTLLRSDHSFRRRSAGTWLMAAQMALSVILLVAAALCVRTLRAVTKVDLGMNPAHVLVARLDPRSAGYAPAELLPLYERLLQAARRVPGVTSVSLSAGGPLGGSINSGTMAVEGYEAPSGERVHGTRERVVGDYTRTLGLRIVSGRTFTGADAVPGRRLSLINETMARKYFGGRPLGRRWGYNSDFDESGYEVIGVVADAQYVGNIRSDRDPMVYILASSDTAGVFLNSLEVRVDGEPMIAIADLRRALRAAEPRLPVRTIEPLDARVAAAAGAERLLASLTTAFAVIALLLACLGLYGMMAYSVTRRTAEIGVRMALGATRGGVRRRVLGEAMTVVALGAAVGVPLAVLLARTLRTQLYGVTPLDLQAYAAALLLLFAVAAGATMIPARRAARLEPMAALRAE